MTTLALQTQSDGGAAATTSTRSNRRRESLLAIINDILDFSKIEARRLDLEHAEFDAA